MKRRGRQEEGELWIVEITVKCPKFIYIGNCSGGERRCMKKGEMSLKSLKNFHERRKYKVVDCWKKKREKIKFEFKKYWNEVHGEDIFDANKG
jgi:hypothetical protein